MLKGLGCNPWFSIWVKPRKTIRAIVDIDPNYHLIVLSIIYGIPAILSFAQSMSWGMTWTLPAILFLAIILSPLIGYIAFTISSCFIFFTGKWLGGKAEYKKIRCAVAWANVPTILNIFMWVVLIICFGRNLFFDFPNGYVYDTLFVTLVFSFILVQLAMGAWSFVLYIGALSEVQEFSIWKSLLNVILAVVIFVVIMAATLALYNISMRYFFDKALLT